MSVNLEDYQELTQAYSTKRELQEWSRAGFTREAIELTLLDRHRKSDSTTLGKASIFAKLYRENIQRSMELAQEYAEIIKKLEKSLENYTGLQVIPCSVCLNRECLKPYRKAYPDACVFSLFIPVENEFVPMYFLIRLKPNTQGETHES